MKIKSLALLTVLGLGASGSAQAADGCKFMLCMGAVNPMAISECASTVREVLRDLSKGRGFPTCKMSNGLDSKTSGSYVTPTRASLTPTCPKGTTQGKDGVVYHSGAMPTNIRKSVFSGYVNLPEGSQNERVDTMLHKGEYSSRVCVSGNQNGTLPSTRVRSDDGWYMTPQHEWYDKVQIMNPDGASYQFNFFIDNKLYSSHRF